MSHFDLSEFPGSPYAAELRAGSLCKLRFAPPLEREFVQSHLAQMRARIRLFQIFALPFAILICTKEVLESGLWSAQTALHLGLFLPAALTVAWIAWSPSFQRLYLPTARVLVPFVSAFGAVCVAADSAAGCPERLAYISTNLISVFFMTGLLFRQAVFTAIAVLVTFITAASLFGLHFGTVLEFSGFLALTGVMASVAHRSVEQSNRRSFVEARLVGELAMRDGLTGLLNRRSFNEQFARAWQQGLRDHRRLAVLMFDVDYFKEYNDRYGHLAGDEALRLVARVIKRIARRPLDCAARYGGEELIVVLYDLPPEHVMKIAEALRRAVERLHLEHGRSKVSQVLTMSVGVAVVTPVPGRSPQGAIQLADEALYWAKAAGRNRVSCKGSDEYDDLMTGRFLRPVAVNHA
jgi:diguanylate cyclase (GGDEF)-like protein